MISYVKTVKLAGVEEQTARDNIADLTSSQNPAVTMTYSDGEAFIIVRGEGEDEGEAKKIAKPVVKELKSRFGPAVYSTDDEATLEDTVVELLARNNLTVSTAESCTGGLLSGRIINVPGASEVIKAGFVTYSNKAKRKFIGVRRSTIEKYGAVSEQTAKEMAKGVVDETGSDVGIATTGIAGPDGGTEEKPVGLVYIACCVGKNVKVKECHFSGTREQIRKRSVTAALNLLRICILEYYTETKLK